MEGEESTGTHSSSLSSHRIEPRVSFHSFSLQSNVTLIILFNIFWLTVWLSQSDFIMTHEYNNKHQKRCHTWIVSSVCMFFFHGRCAAAYVLLAEEEATTIAEAERLFKQALKSGMNFHSFTLTYDVTLLQMHACCFCFHSW